MYTDLREEVKGLGGEYRSQNPESRREAENREGATNEKEYHL
jgi:hypothetical protein